MSYSEIAEEFGCSRQAAFDLVRRTTRKLEAYEARLGLVGRFVEAKDKLELLTSEIEEVRALIKDKKADDIELIDKKLLDISVGAGEIFDFL